MYKFVYIGEVNDYGIITRGLESLNNYNVYYSKGIGNRKNLLVKYLYKIHTCRKINEIIKLPFKTIWRNNILTRKIKKQLNDDDKICFIFTGYDNRLIEIGALQYLRKKYYNSKFVYTFTDKVELRLKKDSDFFEKYKDYIDLFITYNPIDSEKYNIPLHPPIIYNFNGFKFHALRSKFDVFFVGREKGRLKELIKLYDFFEDNSIKCLFCIIGVKKNDKIKRDGIIYNRQLSYKKVLSLSYNSKAIINISQEGANGINLRDSEAISLDKILITNNRNIKELSFYNSKMVIFIDEKENNIFKIKEYGNNHWNLQYNNEYYIWLENELSNLN